ncbi:MAG: glutaminyl-peptide cyclotransferase [Candidatus Latescibacteria bacterium]|nr:glutaminyl-peptide cyclotransferase [Candidatus Latescibacterota bacterium]
MKLFRSLFLILVLAACGSCESRPETPTATPPVGTRPIPTYSYKVLNVYPHDPEAFTQGLVYVDGTLYEGTGLEGRSSLRRVDLETGEVLQQYDLPAQYFGEGIAVLGQRIFQLTWRSHVGFVYGRAKFDQQGEFPYATEGWGLTHDGKHLIMSDGTATLYFLDPDKLSQTSNVEVRDERGPVSRLNELEYVEGEVYANLWQTDRIVRIAPKTGQVLGWIDLRDLLSPADRVRQVDVLNGIAYDAAGKRLFVTGKWWPKLFEIALVPQGS